MKKYSIKAFNSLCGKFIIPNKGINYVFIDFVVNHLKSLKIDSQNIIDLIETIKLPTFNHTNGAYSQLVESFF